MGLQVDCVAEASGCRLHVQHGGYEVTSRWQRYYAVIAPGWRTSLAGLKEYLERA
jgi:hypothetical protein